MLSVNEDTSKQDIITKESIIYFHQIIAQTSQMNTTNSEGKTVKFEDICMRMSSSGCVTLDVMAFWNFNVDNLRKDSNIHRTLSIPKKLASGDLLNAESILGSVQWNSIKTTITSAKSFKYYTLLVSETEDDIISWEKEFTKQMKRTIQEMKQSNNTTIDLRSATIPSNVSLFFNCQHSLSEDITETFVSIGPMFLVSFSVTILLVVTTLVLMRGETSDSIILRILVGIVSIILISLDIFSCIGISNMLLDCNLNPLSAQALPLFLVGIGSDGLFILQTYFNRYREYLKDLRVIKENESEYDKFVDNSAMYYREVISALLFTLIVMCTILILVILVMKHPISMAIRNRLKQQVAATQDYNHVSNEEIEESIHDVDTQNEINEEPSPQSIPLEIESEGSKQIDETPKNLIDKIIFRIFSIVFDRKYFLSHILILLLSIGMIIASIVVISIIEEEPFQMTDLYAKYSQLTSFLNKYQTHYGELEYPGYLVMYNKENSQDLIDFSSISMAKLMDNILETPPTFMKAQINWMSYFKTWIYFKSSHREVYKANKFKIPPQLFNSWMDEFSQDEMFNNLSNFLISKSISKNVTAARIVFSNKNVLNSKIITGMVKENEAFLKQLIDEYPETGLKTSNSFMVNDMDLIFESFNSDSFNIGVICCLAIVSVAIISIMVTSLFEIPIINTGKLKLFLNIVICSIITCFLTLITLIELLAGLKLLGIPINGLSIMNFTLQIGIFSEYLFQITKAFILTKSAKRTYCLLAIPLLICSLSTVVSIFPLAFHDIRMVKKYFFDIIILGQGLLLFNIFIIFPAILLIVERFINKKS